MQFKYLSLAALAAGASAQTMNLTAALMSSPDLTNLTTYVSLFPDLLTQLSMAINVTILAPSNEAFAAFLNSSAGAALATNDTAVIEAVLMYHVLNGTHPAASIMSTPAFVPTMLTNTVYANVTGGQVVEAVTQGTNVEIYSGLLMNSTVTTPLVNTLDSARDVAVFAPNNAAFQAIGSATANLNIMELALILEYHVVNGTVGYSSTLMNGTILTSMSGMNLTIAVSDGSVFVNSAKVVTPNVLVANGVVHVIDNVLNPNNTSAMPIATASTQSVAFAGASSATDNPLTSGVPTPMMTVGMAPTPASGSGSVSGSGTSSSSSGAAMPMRTGAIGAAAFFAGAGVWLNN
ncbi:hypothetical protein OEA41_004965 [Lepraria neglecta]|uniref:FAS1 domain-containing protein n=1 Tax=Lepraria neglecta TaxID=209136 RepID=A0AAD9Z213_9LECA|nr:hypothetical protein OEA41_004965 [Lepraria neglecta]